MSKQRAKGTKAESAVVRWLRANGFPGADRQPLRGNRDCGDIALAPGIVLEVKAHATGATGQPPAMQLAQWLAQCDVERDNAGAEYCPLIVKRAGTTDPAKWWAYLRLIDSLTLLGAPVTHVPAETAQAPICMSLASLSAVLRAQGYGTPHEGEPA